LDKWDSFGSYRSDTLGLNIYHHADSSRTDIVYDYLKDPFIIANYYPQLEIFFQSFWPQCILISSLRECLTGNLYIRNDSNLYQIHPGLVQQQYKLSVMFSQIKLNLNANVVTVRYLFFDEMNDSIARGIHSTVIEDIDKDIFVGVLSFSKRLELSLFVTHGLNKDSVNEWELNYLEIGFIDSNLQVLSPMMSKSHTFGEFSLHIDETADPLEWFFRV